MEVVMATMMKTLMRNGMMTIEMMMKKVIMTLQGTREVLEKR